MESFTKTCLIEKQQSYLIAAAFLIQWAKHRATTNGEAIITYIIPLPPHTHTHTHQNEQVKETNV